MSRMSAFGRRERRPRRRSCGALRNGRPAASGCEYIEVRDIQVGLGIVVADVQPVATFAVVSAWRDLDLRKTVALQADLSPFRPRKPDRPAPFFQTPAQQDQ